jgi:replicative DNA helicase
MSALLRADEAEKALMGWLLTWPERGERVWRELEADGLAAEDFGVPALRELAAAISRLVDRGEVPELASVYECMSVAGREMIGGYTGIAELTSRATAHEPRAHAEIVKRAAARRRVRQWHRESLEQIDTDEDLGGADGWHAWLDRKHAAHSDFAALGRVSSGAMPVRDVLTDTFQEMTNEACGLTQGVSSGFLELDKKVGGKGPKPGWLMVLAGRPGMGKTSFALALTRSCLFDRVGGEPWSWQPKDPRSAVPVLWACDEMSNRELAQRMISDLCSLEGRAVMNPSASWMKANMSALKESRRLLDSSPLSFIDDRDCGRLERIFAAARSWRARHPIDEKGERKPAVVVIDYLQRMTMAGFARGTGREERVSEMTKACKSLAREIGVVVILLAQLNRDCERRDDKRPKASDLRESGAIEQEADVILGAYRPIVYDANMREIERKFHAIKHHRDAGAIREREAIRGQLTDAEIIILKNRHGPQGTVRARFIGEHFRFADRPADTYAEARAS